MYGRHFDKDDELVSHISRKSIDLLKENYRVSRCFWQKLLMACQCASTKGICACSWLVLECPLRSADKQRAVSNQSLGSCLELGLQREWDFESFLCMVAGLNSVFSASYYPVDEPDNGQRWLQCDLTGLSSPLSGRSNQGGLDAGCQIEENV
jgi:hypothetical protein